MSNITNDIKLLAGINNSASTDITAPIRSIVIIGHNTDVDTGTFPETLWQQGGVWVAPTAASTCSVVSSSANDTVAGTGARIVLIEGLNSSYKEIFETVNMNGVTPVVTTQSFYRINALRVVYSGSAQTNAGNITATVDSKVISIIELGDSIAHTMVYTVPVDHALFLTNSSFGIIRSGTAAFSTITSSVYVPSTNTIVKSSDITVDGSQFAQTSHGLSLPRIPEKCDLIYTCTYVSANNIDIFGSVRGLLIYKTYIPKFTR